MEQMLEGKKIEQLLQEFAGNKKEYNLNEICQQIILEFPDIVAQYK